MLFLMLKFCRLIARTSVVSRKYPCYPVRRCKTATLCVSSISRTIRASGSRRLQALGGAWMRGFGRMVASADSGGTTFGTPLAHCFLQEYLVFMRSSLLAT